MKRTPGERIPGQYLPSRAEEDLDAAFRQKARRLVVLDQLPAEAADGELVTVYNATTRALYLYLDGAWRLVKEWP